jgi:tryptophan synthase beta chain
MEQNYKDYPLPAGFLVFKDYMKYLQPNKQGMFGQYGGRVVPKILDNRLKELEEIYLKLRMNPLFQQEFHDLLGAYVNRPSLLYLAERLVNPDKGLKIYLKREDLNHTGAHKINNTVGQALVAKALGKKKLIAETGAGQHGVATATVAAKFGMECTIFMGERDVVNQKVNVYRMQMLGAKVVPVTIGQKTLKDAVDAALTAYVEDEDSYYMLGSAVGPHPYPMMVRDFQSIIGEEVLDQMNRLEGRLPDMAIACVGGGSNAIGLFYKLIPFKQIKLVAVEPAGKGEATERHGLSLAKGKMAVIHGFRTKVLLTDKGEIAESYSAASGLDYPGVGPELAYLKEIGRLETVGITDKDAVAALKTLSQKEGIVPALESAHAIAYTLKIADSLPKSTILVVNLSGRGDKDVENVCENLS